MRVTASTLARIRSIAAEARAIDPDDDQLLADVVEGETDAHEIAAAALRELRDVEALVEALGSQIAVMFERRRRLERAAAAIRRELRQLLEAAGLRRLVLPEATISLRDGSPRTVIDDPDAVPSQLCRVTRRPDLDAIRHRLLAGETIPGARLDTGEPTITIRST